VTVPTKVAFTDSGFNVQNVYKMTYSDGNATFEPLNL